MRVIQLKADGQRLSLESDGDPIVAGTKGGYLQVAVSLGEEWSGYNVAIQFWTTSGKETAVRYADGATVPVPDELTDERVFRISLLGARGQMRLTTNKVSIRQRIV